MIRIITCLLLVSIWSVPGWSQSLSPEMIRMVDAAAKSEIRSQRLVGLGVGIIREGKVVFTRGYGLAVRETGTPFTSQTVTNWASNSKPLIAVVAMQLVESGKLKLEEKIRTYLPELPSHVGGVTVRQVLCHQSGYPHYNNGRIVKLVPALQDVEEGDPLHSLNRFAGSPLLRKPGEVYSYSSYAYVILSAVVQRAGGKPLAELVRQGVTGRLEMNSFVLDEKYAGQAEWSVGYRVGRDGEIARVPPYAHAWKHGAGGYKSSIEDFAKWAAALVNKRLITEHSVNRMWKPQSLSSGQTTNSGLGFFVQRQNGALKIYHEGSHSEARSRLVIYPERLHGMVVFSNCGHAVPSRITTAIYGALRQVAPPGSKPEIKQNAQAKPFVPGQAARNMQITDNRQRGKQSGLFGR